MKLSNSEINEVKKWFHGENYTPIVSNKIIKKLKKGLLFKSLTELRTKHFMNIINLLTKNYNESWHSTVKGFPYKIINSGEKDDLVKETKKNIKNYADSLLVQDKLFLKKGDYVRISLLTFPEYQKDKFLKRFNKNYTKEIYQIHKVSRSPIV